MNCNKIELPVKGNKQVFLYPQPYDYLDYIYAENNIAKNWSFGITDKLTLQSDTENSLKAGKSLVFSVIGNTGFKQGQMTLYTSAGPLQYNVPVPLDETLPIDANHDGVIDIIELNSVAENWLSVVGDFNNDGLIDETEHFLLGNKNLGEILGDYNNNGFVDLGDFSILTSHWLESESWYGQ